LAVIKFNLSLHRTKTKRVMKKELIKLLSENQIKRFNIEFGSYSIKLKNGDNFYSFCYSKMSRVYKDSDTTVTISIYSINNGYALGFVHINSETIQISI